MPVKTFKLKYSLLLFLSLLVVAKTYGQKDSLKPEVTVPRYIYHDQLIKNRVNMQAVDTSLAGLQNYDPGYLNNLGRIGTPVFPLYYQERKKQGFVSGMNQWDAYRLTASSMPYYNTRNPYTDFVYLQGQTVAQRFGVIHSQNIKPFWNFSVHYNRLAYGSKTTLFTSALNNIGVNTWYHSPGRRYMALASMIINKFDADETGGIKNLESYYNTQPGLKNEDAVNLPDAHQLWKDKNFMIQQFLFLGQREQRKIHDTDSVAVTILQPKYYLSHRIDYYENQYIYKDTLPDSGFYPSTYYSPLLTLDQFWYNNWSNELSIAGFNPQDTGGENPGYFARAYIKSEIIQVKQNDLDHYLNNFIVGAEANFGNKLQTGLQGWYVPAGWNQGDFLAKGSITIPFLEKIKMPFARFTASTNRYEPDFTSQYLNTNHFIWMQNLGKVSEMSAKAELFDTASVFNLGASFTNVLNPVYYDRQAQAQQYTGAVQYFRLSLIKDFTFWKFNLNENLTWQKVSGPDILRLPEVVSRTSLFFETRIARKALLSRLGIDAAYNTAYYSYGYMPDIARFYLQDTFKTGNYPVFDLWVSAKVKTFRFMAKMEHINQGSSGRNYFLLPRYPISPRGFRIGLRWTFYN